MAEDELFCSCEGTFVNGLVDVGDSLLKSWDFSTFEAGRTFSLVASAAHSASKGSSKTTAISLFHKFVVLISTVEGVPKLKITMV